MKMPFLVRFSAGRITKSGELQERYVFASFLIDTLLNAMNSDESKDCMLNDRCGRWS